MQAHGFCDGHGLALKELSKLRNAGFWSSALCHYNLSKDAWGHGILQCALVCIYFMGDYFPGVSLHLICTAA